jgi:16S rRNA (guanine527-N7)-methyltransferase
VTRSGHEVVLELFGADPARIQRYVDILLSRGIDYGLLGPREVDRIWERHILNSVALSELIVEGAMVADVGSGAGLPGIPLALLRPDLQLTLIEPLLRRSTFLEEAVRDLGLSDRVEVVRVRAEDHQIRYDVVTARALAPLGRLIGWCNPLRSSAGEILALKGQSAADEVQAAAPTLSRLRLSATVLVVRAHPEAESATVVRVWSPGSGRI